MENMKFASRYCVHLSIVIIIISSVSRLDTGTTKLAIADQGSSKPGTVELVSQANIIASNMDRKRTASISRMPRLI